MDDPFRWLEEESQNTWLFEQEQNRRTLDAMSSDPQRGHIFEELNRLSQYDEWHAPKIREGSMAFLRRSPGSEQNILQFIPAGSQDALTIFDPVNQVNSAIDWFSLSEDGLYVFFGVSRQGDEWSTLYIYDGRRDRILDETISGARWASVYMPPRADFFYYTKYPGSSEDRRYYSQRVFRHEFGMPPEQDKDVFSDADPTASFALYGSHDGTRLVISTGHGWSRNSLSVMALDRESAAATMVYNESSAHMDPFWRNRTLYALHHDPQAGDSIRKWDESGNTWFVVFASLPTQPIAEAVGIDSGFVLLRMQDARYCLEYLSDEGDLQEIELPHGGIGTARGLSCDCRANTVYFEWTSFDQPLGVFTWHVADGRLEKWGVHSAPVPGIRIWQEFVPAGDDMAIPIFLAEDTHKRVSPGPAIVGGYGGFNIAYTPVYAPGIHLWLKSGGLYVVAGLRGGSEFGEKWHRAGMLEDKQHVFDDMNSVLRYLPSKDYSRPHLLGITGRSNGGLLMGAVTTQHPELVRSVVIGVPLMDMLRYDRFLVAALWRSEYGDPQNPRHWQWLERYSPYHHVVPHTKYPAVFIFTSAHDNRVHPLHARKMAARLQKESGSQHPVFLRIEPEAGHGVGKSRGQQINEEADIWTFQFRQLGLDPLSSPALHDEEDEKD